ncbi:hexose transporter HXT13 [Sugiyamaella lignohabitans]|uniref:Hexose transporter HXT13 n=1 Tax=Sugiyamaella lignohabitans TaxID=796027 RepID=A0A167EXR9_9ASCO|nr:hexose transporter HXT13 [Sugiyamaella lignohabitans]ANB14583.1 hexose transporter HXT13 [Sugiyamaella lignohabitans]
MTIEEKNEVHMVEDIRPEGETMEDVLPDYGKFAFLRVPHLLRLNLLLLLCMISSTNNGYDGSMLNGLQSMDSWQDTFNHPKGQHLGGLANGMMFGGIATWPILPYITDRWGRKLPIAGGCVLIIVGAIIQAVSNDYAVFLVGRLILGFGSSFCTGCSPLLLAESSYPAHRHVVTAIYNTLWYLGSIIAAWLTLGTSYVTTTWSWRIPCICQGFLPLIQLLMIYWVPESPRYLIDKHRYAEARALLVKHHAGGDVNSKLVDYEMAEISSALELEKIQNETSYLDFLKTKANKHRLFLIIMIPINMQMSGNGLVSYYLNLVLDSIGITDQRQQLYLNGGLQIYNFFWAVFWTFFVESLGRRRLFLISFSGMLVTYIIWTALSGAGTPSNFANKSLANGVLAMIFLYYFCYGIALNGPAVLYYTEILPYQLRAKGLNITQIVTTLTLIYNGFVNPVAMDAIGWKYYIVWCCVIAVELVICYFFYPETKGHTLETVGSVFGEEVHVTSDLGVGLGRENEKPVA